jgi:ubiquinol-cytochrome c reductase iron-sulfur subunit
MLTRVALSKLLVKVPRACFSEDWYKGSRYSEEGAPLFETATKPGNFLDRTDFKLKLDNWFDEAREFNENESEIKKAQIYICNTMATSIWLTLAKWVASSVAITTAGWIRYFPDKYMEFDIGELPPGEVMQISWHGNPLFIRRFTKEEMEDEASTPQHSLMDTAHPPKFTEAPNSKVLVVSARCTHLGCIPIPYVGKYKGWTCMCHGSIFDKWGRVRQGPALENLKYQNHSLYGNVLCIDGLRYNYEPRRIWIVQ